MHLGFSWVGGNKHFPEEAYLPYKWCSLLPLLSTTSLIQYLNCNVSFWTGAYHGEIHTCRKKSLGPFAPTTPALQQGHRGLCTSQEKRTVQGQREVLTGSKIWESIIAYPMDFMSHSRHGESATVILRYSLKSWLREDWSDVLTCWCDCCPCRGLKPFMEMFVSTQQEAVSSEGFSFLLSGWEAGIWLHYLLT